MAFLPSSVSLTPIRKKLLKQLSDGKWHRNFPEVGIKTFDLMRELGFIRVRHIDKSPRKINNWAVEARITMKGRFLLKNKFAVMDYSQRDFSNPYSIKVSGMRS
jgi:hypothetical protein